MQKDTRKIINFLHRPEKERKTWNHHECQKQITETTNCQKYDAQLRQTDQNKEEIY